MCKEKELLRQQLELLAEQSKNATDRETSEISQAMSEIYKSLKRPTNSTAFLVCFVIANTYFIISFLVFVKKLFGSER